MRSKVQDIITNEYIYLDESETVRLDGVPRLVGIDFEKKEVYKSTGVTVGYTLKQNLIDLVKATEDRQNFIWRQDTNYSVRFRFRFTIERPSMEDIVYVANKFYASVIKCDDKEVVFQSSFFERMASLAVVFRLLPQRNIRFLDMMVQFYDKERVLIKKVRATSYEADDISKIINEGRKSLEKIAVSSGKAKTTVPIEEISSSVPSDEVHRVDEIKETTQKRDKSDKQRTDFSYQLIEELGVLSESPKGWTKEINIVAWNGGNEKYDIREWSPDHDKMSRGITLTEDEARALFETLKGVFE